MIGQTLLGDVQAEHSFELLPSSRVTPEVSAAVQPQEREKDDNLFPESQLEAGDLKGRTLTHMVSGNSGTRGKVLPDLVTIRTLNLRALKMSKCYFHYVDKLRLQSSYFRITL